MLKWKRDIGYNERGEIVAWIDNNYKKFTVKVDVLSNKADKPYYVSTTLTPNNEASIVVGRRIAEITYRIIKDQPNEDAAQAAMRAYARLKGDQWWEDP